MELSYPPQEYLKQELQTQFFNYMDTSHYSKISNFILYLKFRFPEPENLGTLSELNENYRIILSGFQCMMYSPHRGLLISNNEENMRIFVQNFSELLYNDELNLQEKLNLCSSCAGSLTQIQLNAGSLASRCTLEVLTC